jgi:hypothetical protein
LRFVWATEDASDALIGAVLMEELPNPAGIVEVGMGPKLGITIAGAILRVVSSTSSSIFFFGFKNLSIFLLMIEALFYILFCFQLATIFCLLFISFNPL